MSRPRQRFPSRTPAQACDVHFSTLATIEGWEVVDDRGRAVAHKPTAASANGVAFMLNNAAKAGPKALVSVLNRAPGIV